MSKIKRLEKLLLSINSKKQFTLKELSIEFNVSTRTIQRDLLSLMEMGLPIISEFGPHGGYRLESDRILPPIGFTEKEAAAILFSTETYKETSFPFQIQSRSVANKLLQYLPNDTNEYFHDLQKRLLVQFPLPKHSDLSSVIIEAAINQKIMTIQYLMDGTKRYTNIQPIGLFSENGEWFCPAYCYSLTDIYVFRVCDILNAVINYEPMDVKDFSDITIHNWASHFIPRSFLILDVDLASEGIPYCQSHPFLKQFLTEDSKGNMKLEGRILLNLKEKAAEYLWPLKMNIYIRSPLEINALHQKWAEEISAKYAPLVKM
jgi:predicted DNA-binding transcriptional regulator YafY